MATLLVDWLNDGTIPQNKTAGNWTPSAFNTGKFRFTLTFAAASAGSPWRPASLTYWGVLTTNEANGSGIWLEYNPSGTQHRLLFVASDGATNLAAVTLTWGATSAVTVTVDQSSATAGASTLTLSGASSGNGTSAGWNRASVFSGTGLYFGGWGSGGFQLPAGSVTTSDIDDANDAIAGTGTPTVPAITATGAGAVALAGGGSPSVPAVTSAGAGALPLAGTAAAAVPAVTSAGAGAVSIAGTGSATISPVTSAGSGSGPNSIAGTGAPAVPDVTSAGAGALGLAGAGSPAVPAVTSSGAGAVALAGSSSAAVPAVTGSGSGAVELAGTGAAVIGPVTLEATNAEAVALGQYDAQRVLYGSAAGTVTTESLTTKNGSTFVIVTGGNLGDLADPPTDSKGNVYELYGTPEEFDRWAGYGLALWICIDGVGGSGHTFSQEYGQTLGFDEMTIAAVEIESGHHVQGYTIAQALTGAALTFGAITTTAAAVLAAFFCGDAPTGATTTVSLSNGYTVVDTDTLPDHPNGYVPIAIGYASKATAGSYGTTATETPDQGAIMIQVALQVAETIGGTASVTLPAITAAGAGVVAIAGTGGPAVGDVAAAGAGALPIAGAGSPSVGAVAVAGQGALAVAGAGSPTVPAVTAAGAGALPIAGAGSAAVGEVAASGAGTSGNTGTLAATIAPVVAAGSGVLPIAGSSSGAIAAVVSGGAGALAVQGTGSPVVPAVTAANDSGADRVPLPAGAIGAAWTTSRIAAAWST